MARVYQGTDASGQPLTENDEPVLIFGAGYDPSKDECILNDESCNDEVGRGVYLINALDGSLIHSFTDTDMFKDSVASKLTVFDSNGDSYIDRLYVPDTGGNIYRIDMPFTRANKAKVKSRWTTMKLAEFGYKDADSSSANDDRRFFTPLSIVRSRNSGGGIYDGVLIGSGDMTKPNSARNADNYLFHIKDAYTQTPIWADDYKGESDLRVISTPEPKTLSDLANSNNGWKYRLAINESVRGEKSLGAAVVIDGVVHFNTYSPFIESLEPIVLENGLCILNKTGDSNYYQVDLDTGYRFNHRKLPNTIAKDLAVHAGLNNAGIPVLRLLGAGKGDLSSLEGVSVPTGLIDTAVTLTPKATYRYFNEAAQ